MQISSLAFWCASLTLSSGYDITPLSRGALCARRGGQPGSGGSPHSSAEVERPLRAKPHPSQRWVLCSAAPPFMEKHWRVPFSLLWDCVVGGEEGWRWRGRQGDAKRRWGSLRIAGDSHQTRLLVGPLAVLNFRLLSGSTQSRRTHPVGKPEAALETRCRCASLRLLLTRLVTVESMGRHRLLSAGIPFLQGHKKMQRNFCNNGQCQLRLWEII